jgi:hypothetical protein
MSLQKIKSQIRRGDVLAAAEISGLSRGTVMNYLKGKVETTPENELLIMAAFNQIFKQREEKRAAIFSHVNQ